MAFLNSKVKILQPWEFWPIPFIYFWIYGFYLMLAIRFRHPAWFSAVNPCMPYGGLYGYSKAELLRILPSCHVPKFILVEPKSFDTDKHLEESFHFPLILKPDVGERGIGVMLINSKEELKQKLPLRKWPQIIQEYANEPEEYGILCERSLKTGRFHVTSVTSKAFLEVVGDGKKTTLDLLQLEKRNRRYTRSLSEEILSIIPGKEETIRVEPIGNHNRGTQFFDSRDLITTQLEKWVNDLLKDLKGFNFGRLDVRCNSWEELLNGKFKIIELNGVASEPTHIYEGGFSYFEGQKALFRQWNQMARRTIFELKIERKLPPIIQTFRDFGIYRGKLKKH